MSNVHELKAVEGASTADGLRAIATALDNGTLREPPYALVVFGFRDDDTMLTTMPVGKRLPGQTETVGMLTIAANAIAFGEANTPEPLPID